jgi:hypothetical protein
VDRRSRDEDGRGAEGGAYERDGLCSSLSQECSGSDHIAIDMADQPGRRTLGCAEPAKVEEEHPKATPGEYLPVRCPAAQIGRVLVRKHDPGASTAEDDCMEADAVSGPEPDARGR